MGSGLSKYVVHIGVNVKDLMRFHSFFPADQYRPTIDGDGWNEWGAPPGRGVNDSSTLHVTFDDLMQHEKDRIVHRATRLPIPLTPMGGLPGQMGVLVAVTGAEWDCEFETISEVSDFLQVPATNSRDVETALMWFVQQLDLDNESEELCGIAECETFTQLGYFCDPNKRYVQPFERVVDPAMLSFAISDVLHPAEDSHYKMSTIRSLIADKYPERGV